MQDKQAKPKRTSPKKAAKLPASRKAPASHATELTQEQRDALGTPLVPVPDEIAEPFGRPTKRTPERRKDIIDCLKLGMTLESAARYAGISYETLNRWQQDDGTFANDIENARGFFEREALEQIRAAAEDPKNWAATAWRLERIMPALYARKWQPLAMAQEQPNAGAPGKVYKVSIAPADESDES